MDDTKQQKSHSTKWHNMDEDVVLDKLDTTSDRGLAEDEAQKRLDQYGKNKLPEGRRQSAFKRFVLQFHNILIYLLLIASVVTALMSHWIDTFVILAVVIINAFIGFIQEGKAEKAIEGIKNMLSPEATVIRDKKQRNIDAVGLVPGDIVIIGVGNKVPADIRILSSKNLRTDEAILTGESNDVNKKSHIAEEDATIGDRHCMVFSGTVVTSGEGKGVVVATGESTEIGKVSQMLTDVEKITTPLLQKIERFGIVLSFFIVGVGTIVFSIAYFVRGYSIYEAIMALIGIVVASIPEGLPAIMTITLAIGVQRMAKRHSIIRRLPSVETLGAVSVICTDKTGTLTRNEMTVKTIITAEDRYEVEGVGYKPKGEILKKNDKVNLGKDGILEWLIKCFSACNNSNITKNDEGNWELIGTPTEGALITLAYKFGLSDFKPKRIDSIPFDSENKFMATMNEVDNKKFVFIKGAPEKLLDMCSKQLIRDKEEDIDQEFWKEKFDEVAKKGQRLLCAAYCEVNSDKEELDDIGTKCTIIGFVGLFDPPREEVLDAIKECKEAGIRVVMITGDHSLTAQTIAKELGICDNEEVITGDDLEKMDDEELKQVSIDHNVYARTSPEHKLRLVKSLQANNLLCAMTGDGVNDAPALKRANIGIAMGIKGTEVAKDSSEMILADDNFTSIVNAVEEGRTVYDNLRKTILFLLPANGAEATVIIAAILFGLTLPITPVQILWVNMVSAVTLALSLSMEPMEHRVMKLPPRPPQKPILDKYFVWRVVFVSLLSGGMVFVTFMRNYQYSDYFDLDYSRTIAVNMLVSGHLFYLLTCRKLYESSISKSFFDNKYVFMSVGILIMLQLTFTYLPLMNKLFQTTPISFKSWLFPLLIGIIVFFLVETEKLIFRFVRRYGL